MEKHHDEVEPSSTGLAQHALNEINLMQKSLDGRLLPAITVLLHVPIATLPGVVEEPLDAGMLVDVRGTQGVEPGAATFVAQSAGSGVSGQLTSSADFATGFRATSMKIDEEVVRNYKKLNPVGLRRSQVVVERERYSDIKWTRDDAPPKGSYIHHHPMATHPDSFYHPREPSFGTVYTLTADMQDDRISALPLAALIAAKAAMKVRLKIFGDRLSHLRPVLGVGRPSHMQTDAMFSAAAAFLFAHHWFYPYSPIAYEAMMRLALESNGLDLAKTRKHVASVYTLHNWTPPLLGCNNSGMDLSNLIKSLAADLALLAAYHTGAEYSCHAPEQLESYIASVLFTLFGQPVALNQDCSGVAKTSGFQDDDFVALIPPKASASLDNVCLPVFKYSQLRRLAHSQLIRDTEAKNKLISHESGPGEPKIHRTYQFNPERAIKQIEDGGRMIAESAEDRCKNFKWLIRESIALFLKHQIPISRELADRKKAAKN